MFLQSASLKKCVLLCFQPISLSEVLVIANIRHATSKVWTCTEPKYRLCLMKLCNNDNHHTTTLLYRGSLSNIDFQWSVRNFVYISRRWCTQCPLMHVINSIFYLLQWNIHTAGACENCVAIKAFHSNFQCFNFSKEGSVALQLLFDWISTEIFSISLKGKVLVNFNS